MCARGWRPVSVGHFHARLTRQTPTQWVRTALGPVFSLLPGNDPRSLWLEVDERGAVHKS